MLKKTKFVLHKKYVEQVIDFLNTNYSTAKCDLNFKSPFQLLVATILSAQCTDVRVNKTTVELFAKYPTVEIMALANLEDLETIVHPCGFFRNKALNILTSSKIIIEEYNGKVPDSLKELIKLPGVGRKTANVVLGNAFNIPGLTVDTHLGRISQRLKLSEQKTAEKIEKDLAKIIPQEMWTIFSHQAIAHGRALCKARKPLCLNCCFNLCPSRLN